MMTYDCGGELTGNNILTLIYKKKAELVVTGKRTMLEKLRAFLMVLLQAHLLEYCIEPIDDWSLGWQQIRNDIVSAFCTHSGYVIPQHTHMAVRESVCVTDDVTLSKFMQLNRCMFGSSNISNNNSFGRRIDLLIKSGKENSMEFCSNKRKRQNTDTWALINQQYKNIRPNSAILHQLREMDSTVKFPSTVAMDWLDMYVVLDVNGMIVTKTISQLIMPRTLMDMCSFKRSECNERLRG
ncbi:hypothetical protein BC941DRAFT_430510 [Chlamydoabsidia padenii]|nr:hypothetical protein BC941DRAFT_430510 [Chlamydoabsidia padenii]